MWTSYRPITAKFIPGSRIERLSLIDQSRDLLSIVAQHAPMLCPSRRSTVRNGATMPYKSKDKAELFLGDQHAFLFAEILLKMRGTLRWRIEIIALPR